MNYTRTSVFKGPSECTSDPLWIEVQAMFSWWAESMWPRWMAQIFFKSLMKVWCLVPRQRPTMSAGIRTPWGPSAQHVTLRVSASTNSSVTNSVLPTPRNNVPRANKHGRAMTKVWHFEKFYPRLSYQESCGSNLERMLGQDDLVRSPN
jgi:hypothetical protein